MVDHRIVEKQPETLEVQRLFEAGARFVPIFVRIGYDPD